MVSDLALRGRPRRLAAVDASAFSALAAWFFVSFRGCCGGGNLDAYFAWGFFSFVGLFSVFFIGCFFVFIGCGRFLAIFLLVGAWAVLFF